MMKTREERTMRELMELIARNMPNVPSVLADKILKSRWLAEHDRQVAERAWDAAYVVGLDRGGYHGPDLNPYRAAKGEQK